MKKIIFYFLLLITFIIVFGRSYLDHLILLMSSSGIQYVIQGRWDIALLNIVFFSSFLLLLSFRKKANWKTSGIYSAFIISLFVEMYGFPLSIFFASSFIRTSAIEYN